jgi:hypothetical protein
MIIADAAERGPSERRTSIVAAGVGLQTDRFRTTDVRASALNT